ncbi:MAG: 2-amino-4-hydroxy-6-hydroxymethyldihydropteridine diphosphokinase [Brevinematia bacterium]
MIILSLGSNIEPRIEYIKLTISYLREFFDIFYISSLYETDPIGYVDQGKFLNLVIVGNSNKLPFDLLKLVKNTERRVGRIERFRWGPREIDIDIIYYKKIVIKSNELIIPHKERLKRSFVLFPLFEVLPSFVDPQYDIPIGFFVNKLKKQGIGGITLLKSKFL